ncbi:MAG: kinase [Elusimicrobia bacterium RIFOXYC2_FULL_34_12]|nr:MAG: kinase [Elusimicrobia bacterium RIFOXYC2_FULL_34_12]OGS38256.1 MAG: kinase [Elusimicrobia bacterium RIFOXYD2_FULL_34_30]HAM39136.1 kinase [Elusimicrobiota bacterium]
MIITRTPHRISFFGGGTDYPTWYLRHNGKVLGAAIDKYCYLIVRELPPFFEHKHRIVYSQMENAKSINEIKHPSVREILNYFNYKKGISIHHDGDIPARSGMGSSSTFTVGLLKAMFALQGQIISKNELFKLAIHIEQNVIKENVGSQDQVFAAQGGFNKIDFLNNGEIVVTPVLMTKENVSVFEKKFMLFFTGLSRIASEIAIEQIKNTTKKEKELHKMGKLVDEAYKIITSKTPKFKLFGKLLDETWKLKRTLSTKISNSFIDDIYNTAMRNGAIGGKLLGAGGGGFMLFYVEPENRMKVKKSLKGLLNIPFEFDFSGSEIIFYRPYSENTLGNLR